MPGGVRVLGAEGGAEGVDVRKRAGEGLALQLPAHGQVGRLAEKIRLGLLVDVPLERGDAEHLARAFAIAGGDDRGVHIDEIALLEELVDGVGQPAARAEHRAEQVRARTQVRDGAQELEACAPSSAADRSASASPTSSIRVARSSHFCPAAGEATRSPSTTAEAPVVNRWIWS